MQQANTNANANANARRTSTGSMSLPLATAVDPPIMHPEEEEEDRQHVQRIIQAFRLYRKYAYARVDKTETYLNSLPQRHQEMLAKYRNHLGVLRDCIDANQTVIKKMLRENILHGHTSNGVVESVTVTHQDVDGPAVKIRPQDMEYAQSTLKLIARDWSSQGEEEREQSYRPIIEAIEEFYKPGEYELNEIKILVPGAGLGRLTYELACRGYECEGNEFSYFMMIASNFVLNQCNEENKYTLYPWVHQYVNNLRMADQVAPIRFPDVSPAKHPPKGTITMAAGDFIEVYKVPNSYDCVATCFFIDCANNVVDFIETIYRILVPGGIWVNLGPLLYHFSDMSHENSIEPTFENITMIIEMIGFEIVRCKTGLRTKYAQNPQSMLKSEYESLFWICRKPINCNSNNEHGEHETAASNELAHINCDNYTMESHSAATHTFGSSYSNGFDKFRH